MLDRIAQRASDLAGLVEAETKLMRLHVVRLGAAAMLGAFALVLLSLGAMALATGATWLLAQAVGVPIALVVAGALIVLAGAGGAGAIYRALD